MTDNTPKGLRRSIAAIEAEFHKLLRDAPWKHNNESTGPRRQSEDKSPDTPREIAVVFPSPQDTKSTNSTEKKSFPWWRVAEGIGILSAVIVAGVNVFQWRDLQRNFEADQRSWLRVLSDINPETIKGTAIGVHFKNFGKVVAESIVVDAIVEVVDSDSAPKLKVEPPLTRAYSGFLFPSDEPPASPVPIHPSPQGNLPITVAEIDSLSKGKAYLAIYGIATYRDHFRRHWTRFCYWSLQTDPSKTFYANAKACTEWNAFGDGDPPK